jgi:hypothetical protein
MGTKITLEDDTYFQLLGLKSKLKVKTWSELVDKIDRELKDCEEYKRGKRKVFY